MPRKGKTHLLRKGRFSESGRIYLITIVCWHRLPHFAQFAAGRCVVKSLMAVQPSAATLCYVVMPDHIHWLMQLNEGADLSAAVQKIKSLASKSCRALGLELPLWQKGFHDHGLRAEEDVIAVARYVVANPLRAGLVASIKEYSLWDACWL